MKKNTATEVTTLPAYDVTARVIQHGRKASDWLIPHLILYFVSGGRIDPRRNVFWFCHVLSQNEVEAMHVH